MIDLIAKAEALEAIAKELRDEAARDTHTLPLFVEPLPRPAQDAYRLLMREGFTLHTEAADQAAAHGDAPRKHWSAPTDEPLTTEQIMAVATLHEYGFGGVVRPA